MTLGKWAALFQYKGHSKCFYSVSYIHTWINTTSILSHIIQFNTSMMCLGLSGVQHLAHSHFKTWRMTHSTFSSPIPYHSLLLAKQLHCGYSGLDLKKTTSFQFYIGSNASPAPPVTHRTYTNLYKQTPAAPSLYKEGGHPLRLYSTGLYKTALNSPPSHTHKRQMKRASYPQRRGRARWWNKQRANNTIKEGKGKQIVWKETSRR